MQHAACGSPSRGARARSMAYGGRESLNPKCRGLQGVWEKDAERKDDSFNTFEEVLQMAVEHERRPAAAGRRSAPQQQAVPRRGACPTPVPGSTARPAAHAVASA